MRIRICNNTIIHKHLVIKLISILDIQLVFCTERTKEVYIINNYRSNIYTVYSI